MSLTSGILRSFIRWNKRLSFALQAHLPYRKMNFMDHYLAVMVSLVNVKKEAVLLDVGCGEESPIGWFRDPALRIKLIGLDVLPEAIARNREVDERIIADANLELGIPSASVDLITSRTVLEHLQDNGSFFDRSVKALKPGGYFVHVFPAKYALYAMINRLLPASFSKRILHFFHPESTEAGFPAYYDRCSYSGMNELLKKYGFELLHFDCYYYSSNYFAFFFPLYLLSVLYESIVWLLGLRNFASYYLIVARKPE